MEETKPNGGEGHVIEANLLQRQKKKMKQSNGGFISESSNLIAYDDEILREGSENFKNSSRSYTEMLLGISQINEDLSLDGEDDFEKQSESEVGEEDFNGFNIIEEFDKERPCPTFRVSPEEEKHTSRPWRKSLLIKLLGWKIGFKALEMKLFQLWAKDGSLDIIDLTIKFYLIKFSTLFDYEYALTSGPWILYDYYLTIRKWELDFDLEDSEISQGGCLDETPQSSDQTL